MKVTIFNGDFPDPKAAQVTADDLVRKIAPLLEGKDPRIQGLILADLTAMWLAGHPAGIREGIASVQNKLVKGFLELHAPRIDAKRKGLGL